MTKKRQRITAGGIELLLPPSMVKGDLFDEGFKVERKGFVEVKGIYKFHIEGKEQSYFSLNLDGDCALPFDHRATPGKRTGIELEEFNELLTSCNLFLAHATLTFPDQLGREMTPEERKYGRLIYNVGSGELYGHVVPK